MTKRLSRLETASVLSVIIPVYNEAQTIGRILQQVVGAVPETPKQIVIVDDCSTDGTQTGCGEIWRIRRASGAGFR
jgi:cellulose synthase/poly-beta-1,6-N-acetylglucosamine synthase-like glycosyltransferase